MKFAAFVSRYRAEREKSFRFHCFQKLKKLLAQNFTISKTIFRLNIDYKTAAAASMELIFWCIKRLKFSCYNLHKQKVKVHLAADGKLIMKNCTNTSERRIDTNTASEQSLQTGFRALFMWTWSENVIINCCSMVQWCNCATFSVFVPLSLLFAAHQ